MSLSTGIGTTPPADTLADPGTTARVTTGLLSRGVQTYFWGGGGHLGPGVARLGRAPRAGGRRRPAGLLRPASRSSLLAFARSRRDAVS
jgi:hypothetical protein